MTVLAWGNCLGDMSADVAMTKKGFGEMAITATMAGPIFNILVGGFLSNFCWLIQNPDKEINFTAYEEDSEDHHIQPVALLPILMLTGQVVCLIILLFNAMATGYNLNYKGAISNIIVYLAIIGFLVYWAIS